MKTGIFITKAEAEILINGLNALVESEQDTQDYTKLYKLLTEVEE